jgi:hydroxymethylpyrimidine pyrophosphatase-like HAD family hydrolase
MNKDQIRSFIQEEVSKILNEETEYQKYFKQMMDVFGIDSPQELNDKEKKKFFDFVSLGWNEDTDTKDQEAIEQAKDYVQRKDGLNESSKKLESFKRAVRQLMERGVSKEKAVREVVKRAKKK